MDNKVPQQINDIVGDNVKKLAQLFPSVVKDGEVDFEALKEELGQFEEVGSEKYEFTWAGKKNAKKIAQEDVIGRTLKFIPEDSKDADTTENLYIEGDNLEVLKLLRQNYYGAIKMIYIDPPYNTGNDFVYKDNFDIAQAESDVLEGAMSNKGERYSVNLRSHNRFHAIWLSSIYTRIKIAKDLLTDDGVLFISIDNNEISNLKKIADEIFGEEKFVTCLHVQMSTVQGQKVRAAKVGNIVKNGEYILIYSKNGDKAVGRKPLLDAVKYDNHYNKMLIEKNQGLYECINLSESINENKCVCEELELLGLCKEGKISSSNFQDYYEVSPLFRKYVNDRSKMIVRIHDSVDVPETFKDRMKIGLVYQYSSENRDYLVTKNQTGKIMQCIPLSDKIQSADDFYKTFGPTTIRGDWWAGFYLDMGNVSKEGEVAYDNGKKPVRLIKQLVDLCTEDGDIILDFYSGSATTAHAVMELEAEIAEKRKFIMIQVNEDLDKSLELSDADNKKTLKNTISFLDSINKPHILSELGKERIRRSGDKIKSEHPDADLDIGFKVFRTADTNIKWNSLMNMGQIDINQMETSPDTIDFMSGAKDVDIVYELMLRQNDVPLSSKVEQIFGGGYERTYLYADSYLVCLETKITNELIDKLAETDPLPIKFIFRDSAFQDDIALKDETFRRLKALIEKNHGMQKKTYTVEFL